MPELTQEQIDDAIIAVHDGDEKPFIETFLTIPTKRNEIAPFKLNRLQQYVHQHRTGREYWLKYRQGGSSVYQLARLFARTVTIPYHQSAIITLSTDNGRQKRLLFNHIERYQRSLIEQGLLGKESIAHQTEEYVEYEHLQSNLFIGTVGQGDFGRGVTLNALMVTELGSFTPQEAQNVLTSAIESVVPGGLIIFETTPKLLGSPAHTFYLECKNGEKPYQAMFLPWYVAEDYYLPPGSIAALPDDRGVIELDDFERGLASHFPQDGIPIEDRIRWRRSKLAERGRDFYSEYPEDEISCWQSASTTLFPSERLKRMMDDARDPYDIRMDTRYYKAFDPSHSYAIGIDAAAGVPDGDFSAGVVMDVQSGDVVAVMHGRITPKVFAYQLCQVASEYGKAMVGGERDAWTMQVMDEMEDLGYPNVYYDEDEAMPKKGFQNTNQSRAQGVASLLDGIKLNNFWTCDRALIAELYQYSKSTDSRSGVERFSAPKGLHDDLCVAAQRAQQLRGTIGAQRSYTLSFGGPQGVELVAEYPTGLYR